jgi:hypothetical protein
MESARGEEEGGGGGDRGPAGRASRGVREEEEALERGGQLASVCRSSGTSAMVAQPRRSCCADSPPTPRSGPAHLAVSRLAIGEAWRDVYGERTNGRRKAGLAGRNFFFFFSFLFFFFFFFFFFK